ncbi:transcriptional regulator, TetR family [Klenkia soli]|uniref:Transcriptional regulator, TetR family n=1 Tax=Klenkia soli TaxID=1052260 RepID=A0A1H0GP58_9ACTN|nr:TetR/AcrR family transcriptional regulator [Klenkia soli]SDO08491.1 transcriptional regulator, TetR family [Klenkia soli]
MSRATPENVPLRPRPRRDQVRGQVLAAARQVFAERGFAGATTDHVAAAAGFTKGAVYSNFRSKDDLFIALLEAESAARIQAVERALSETTDLAGALVAVGGELSRRDPLWQVLYLEFVQRALREPEVRAALVTSRRELRARITGVVERFMADHPVRAGWRAGDITVVLLALSGGLAMEALPDPSAVHDELLPQVLVDLLQPVDS